MTTNKQPRAIDATPSKCECILAEDGTLRMKHAPYARLFLATPLELTVPWDCLASIDDYVDDGT